MRFKGAPWDFLRQYPSLRKGTRGGLWGFYCVDAYLQKLLLGRMGVEDFSIRWGEDATFDWFRDNVINSNLFSTNGNYLIYNAEHLEEGVREAILQHSNWEGKTILLCFSKKDKFFVEISKLAATKFLHIESPRFWEGEKLLNFLCEQMKLQLTHEVKNYLLNTVSHEIPDLIQILKFLSLNIPRKGILSRSEVEKLIEPKELNPFHLAKLLSLKKFKEFYGALLEKRIAYDTYRSTFSFMQIHLLKLGDPRYVEKKSRPSKYDQDILRSSKDWSGDEIRTHLRLMGEWEIYAKKRDPFLITFLRCHRLAFL